MRETIAVVLFNDDVVYEKTYNSLEVKNTYAHKNQEVREKST